ncbi:uncharacterized protein RCC_06904 [Ramularia collo-cygni]|uniref:Uncharacterized protein n=1 Tax=Ramularia collo-cygni TaxID=112498 RepID=A0A2D3VJE8_9PEZI|nr:uncharacterized protein RCC_06904 [Ramularia collo-cygni]CZT21043.1 uncharacterized protein RCC_06904 [Ramularia collo-cygni]
MIQTIMYREHDMKTRFETRIYKTAADEMDTTEDVTPAAPALSLFFSKLPRELRDECYRHAYESEHDGAFKMTSLSDYLRRERDRRKYGSLRLTPVVPRETPICPLLDMRVSKKFFEEATEQWFRQREISCGERYVFNSICDSSPTLRKCLTRFSCVWDSCYFASDSIAEACSAFAHLKRCKGIRTLDVEVRERTFEEFNRLACVDSFTADDFQTMQEARDLLTLPLLTTIQMRPSKCSLGVTAGEKAKWIENVAALDGYMKYQLELRKLARAQQKVDDLAKERARYLERERRKARKHRISQWTAAGNTMSDARPSGLLARARNLFAFGSRTSESSTRSAPAEQGPRNRTHPALRPSASRPTVRFANWKISQDKINKRALIKREKKQQSPFMDRINDLEDAYAGIQELFEGREPRQPERGGVVAFYKKYPIVVVSLATTTTLSVVNSIALWNVLSQR